MSPQYLDYSHFFNHQQEKWPINRNQNFDQKRPWNSNFRRPWSIDSKLRASQKKALIKQLEDEKRQKKLLQTSKSAFSQGDNQAMTKDTISISPKVVQIMPRKNSTI